LLLKNAVDKFHIHYEKNRLWENTRWLGVPIWKLPFDAFVIQDLIYKIRPNIIIEAGTGKGGSSVFYASIQKLLDIKDRNVITIDIKDNMFVADYLNLNIVPLKGSSLNPDILKFVDLYALPELTTMVILDSWHSYDHVLEEMKIYSNYVSVGSYMIVEDSHVSGHPIKWEWGDEGPYEAIEDFIKNNNNFTIDKSCEKFIMTFNPSGYLLKTGDR
jgi:cephalosporin hydroxylase